MPQWGCCRFWMEAGGPRAQCDGHSRMQILETYMFHSFLKARLNGRMDAFARMDLDTQSEEDRCLALFQVLFGRLRARVSVSFEHSNDQLSGLLSLQRRILCVSPFCGGRLCVPGYILCHTLISVIFTSFLCSPSTGLFFQGLPDVVTHDSALSVSGTVG